METEFSKNARESLKLFHFLIHLGSNKGFSA